MTTSTLDAPATATSPAAHPRVGLRDALAAEWLKIRTVRSTAWTLAALVVVSVAATALVCASAADWLASGEADEAVGSFLTWGLSFGQIGALVLGVLVVSSEYASGMIRSTLGAVPRRWHVVAAKTAVVAAVLLVLGTVASFGSYFAGNAFLSAEGIGVPLDAPDVLRSLFGGGLYLAALGVFGVALALLVRHTAGAVTIGLGIIFVLGNLVMLIPGEAGEWITKLMPGNAGSTIATVVSFNPDALGPWQGYGVFLAEIALLLALGTVRLIRRDA